MDIKSIFNHPLLNTQKQLRYSNLRMVIPENVAEHSSLVANLGLVISNELNKIEGSEIFNLKELAYKSVIHDYGEAFTCDVVTTVKYSDLRLKKLLDELEFKELSKFFSDNTQLVNDIVNSKDESPEGSILTLSDRLQALFKVISEFNIQRTKCLQDSVIRISNSVIEVLSYLKDCSFIKNDRTKLQIESWILDLNDIIENASKRECYV